MIISASRRTDIPSFYSEWFMNRMRDGYVLTRNPMNPKQISRISLLQDDIDGIVFWTKNPLPMLENIKKLGSIPYYFQFTLNPYGKDIECNVPSKNNVTIPAFYNLCDIIGPERIIWRYDPIILTDKYTIDYHIEYFEKLASKLSGCTNACVISFLDIYRNTRKNLSGANLLSITEADMHNIARHFSAIASKYKLKLSTCAEAIDFEQYGISHSKCVDPVIFERITGNTYKYSKDMNQRIECGCMPSIDIGAYNSCLNGCLYCYANYNKGIIPANAAGHDPCSPILIGNIPEDSCIKDRINISQVAKNTLLD